MEKQSKEYNSIEEYVDDHVKEGYINEKLEPLKCINCKSTNLKDKIRSMDEVNIHEYECICNDCGTSNGYWAYGHWQL